MARRVIEKRFRNIDGPEGMNNYILVNGMIDADIISVEYVMMTEYQPYSYRLFHFGKR